MDLSESTIWDRAREYAETEPLYDVERQHVETVPTTFAGDEYGRRDVQWIVRWYFRRYLGEYPDRERREREESFRDNDFGDVMNAIGAAVDAVGTRETATGGRVGSNEPFDADGVTDALDALTALDGIDIAVASGFLQFLAPSRFIAIDPRTWRVLVAAGELNDPYPEPSSAGDYRRFDDACRAVMARTGVDAWTLYRALWQSVSELPDAKRGVGSDASP